MIKFLDLQKINKRFELEFNNKVREILSSGIYLNGKELKHFETKFAEFCGSQYCVGCANGLNALELIIKAYDFKENDEIIIPANTYIASIWAVIHNNCKPVFVEPDIKTYNIDTSRIEEKITCRTKAIMPVHLYGQAVDMKKIYELAKKYNLLIIEDGAQAHGARYKGRFVGNLGNAAGFSFYPSKNLGALSNAGGITTDNKELAEKVRALANYGSYERNNHVFNGTNSRLDEIQSAFLNIKLNSLSDDNKRRREISRIFRNNINNPDIVLPETIDEDAHVWHLFTIRTKQRDKFRKYMYENGIETAIHYPVPFHKQVSSIGYHNLQLPITELIHQTIVSLPISPMLTNFEIEKIVDTVNKFKC